MKVGSVRWVRGVGGVLALRGKEGRRADCLDRFLEFLLLLCQELLFLLELDVLFIVSGHLLQDSFGSFLDFLYPPSCENQFEGMMRIMRVMGMYIPQLP